MEKPNEVQRIGLIIEAIRYCQRVKQMGMPPACYSKALREPVHFLWTLRGGGPKDRVARYRSTASIGVKRGEGRLVFDHAIPFKYLEAELLGLGKVTPETVRPLLLKYEICVLITKDDNEQLNQHGLKNRMPPGWDGVDSLARYAAAGIELVENHP